MAKERFTAEGAEGRGGKQRENRVGDAIIDASIKVHSALGPGLLESAYEACLMHELTKRGHRVDRQVLLAVRYDDVVIDAGYRLDLLVDECVVCELKAVDTVLPVHIAQVISYLKLGRFKLGYLLNFNVVRMKDGIRRLVNGL